MAVTFTEYHDRAMMVVKAKITMTATDPETFGPTTHSYYGFVVQCFVDETDAPDDNYDITINDEFGVDVLNGKGQTCPLTRSLLKQTLTMAWRVPGHCHSLLKIPPTPRPSLSTSTLRGINEPRRATLAEDR